MLIDLPPKEIRGVRVWSVHSLTFFLFPHCPPFVYVFEKQCHRSTNSFLKVNYKQGQMLRCLRARRCFKCHSNSIESKEEGKKRKRTPTQGQQNKNKAEQKRVPGSEVVSIAFAAASAYRPRKSIFLCFPALIRQCLSFFFLPTRNSLVEAI